MDISKGVSVLEKQKKQIEILLAKIKEKFKINDSLNTELKNQISLSEKRNVSGKENPRLKKLKDKQVEREKELSRLKAEINELETGRNQSNEELTGAKELLSQLEQKIEELKNTAHVLLLW